jgi:hypothetical protein
MYKQDSIHQVLMDYKITVTDRKMERRQRFRPYSLPALNDPSLDPYMQIEEEIVTIIKADIPEKELMAMADTLCEMRDLMRDPETAKLLMEARFINRLKRGF